MHRWQNENGAQSLLWGFGAFFCSYCSTMGVRKERKLSLGRFLISWIWCQA